MKVKVAQSCPTLCNPVDCSLPGFSVHGILQARILEWVAISLSRGSSRPRDRTQVSRIGGRHFNLWESRSCVRLFVTLWTLALQALLSVDLCQEKRAPLGHDSPQWKASCPQRNGLSEWRMLIHDGNSVWMLVDTLRLSKVHSLTSLPEWPVN